MWVPNFDSQDSPKNSTPNHMSLCRDLTGYCGGGGECDNKKNINIYIFVMLAQVCTFDTFAV